MLQTLSQLTDYFISRIVDESKDINEFNTEFHPLICARFMQLYNSLWYVERHSQEFNAELYAISKQETPLTKVVLQSKARKLFESIENFNFQLLNLEYLGNHHVNSLRNRSPKAVWQYPDEWRIDAYDWIVNNCKEFIVKNRYAIYPLMLTSPIVDTNQKSCILKYPTKIPNASMQAEVLREISPDSVNLRVQYSSSHLTFGCCVNRGACGAYEHILSGETSCQMLRQSISKLLEIQEFDLRSVTNLKALCEDSQSSIEVITRSKHTLSHFIRQKFELDKILT